MNQETVNFILHRMSKVLDNSQMIQLEKALEETLEKHTISEQKKFRRVTGTVSFNETFGRPVGKNTSTIPF